MKVLSPRRLVAVAAASMLGAPLLATLPAEAADPVVINLVGINDFHGRIDAATVQWAGTVKQLEADAPVGNSLIISAGDNVSASLFASAVQDDNPTIDVLNALGLDASATGNHEFDKGYGDLVNRIIPRADFPVLGANVKKADGSNALDASATFDIQGVKVAVVGAVTQDTPSLVSPAGIEGLTFQDPVTGINNEVTRLNALPEADRPDVIVASFHEGAPEGTLTYAQSAASSAVFKHLAEDTSADVDAIFMGHTHQKYAYDAPVPGTNKIRPILQTGQYGENVGQIKLTYNPDTDAVSYTQRNVARSTATDASLISSYPSLASVNQIRNDAVAYANQVGSVTKGQITGQLTRASTTASSNTVSEDRASESNLGNLIADALLFKVGSLPAGADLALVNPGGIRADLRPGVTSGVQADGSVSYAALNSVLPFANNLVSVKLKGSSIKKLLEQQWQRDAQGNVPSRPYLQLGTSKNVTYTFDPTLPEGSRIQSVLINGAALDPAKEYKVATFSFLAAAGDNFFAFKEGTVTDTALVDRDGWIQFFEENSPVDPSYAKHAVQTAGVKKQYRVGSAVSVTLSKLDLTSLGTPAATRVVSKLVYEGGSRNLGTQAVTNGTSAPIAFTLPAGVGGAMRIESTAYAGSLPVGTKVTVPLDVTGATVTGTAGEPVAFGAPLPVTVNVTGPEEQPTGTVTLKKGDVTVGTGTLVDGQVVVQADTTLVGAGATPLTIAYGGDANYQAATGTVAVVVTQAGTTTTGTGPALETPIDGSADVKIDVASATETVPTGEVAVIFDDEVIGTGTLDDGSATVSTDVSSLEIGSNEVTVSYAGDANHSGSEGTATIKVKKGVPTLEVTATGAPYGTSSTIDVTTDSGVNGLIFLFEDGQSVGMGIAKDGKATIKIPGTALQPGTHTIDVVYNGSPSFEPTEPTSVDLTVTKAKGVVTYTAFNPKKVVTGKTQATVSLKVTAAGFTPTGQVRLTYPNSGYSKVVTLVDGRATFTLGKFGTTGRKTLTATFLGSSTTDAASKTYSFNVVSK